MLARPSVNHCTTHTRPDDRSQARLPYHRRVISLALTTIPNNRATSTGLTSHFHSYYFSALNSLRNSSQILVQHPSATVLRYVYFHFLDLGISLDDTQIMRSPIIVVSYRPHDLGQNISLTPGSFSTASTATTSRSPYCPFLVAPVVTPVGRTCLRGLAWTVVSGMIRGLTGCLWLSDSTSFVPWLTFRPSLLRSPEAVSLFCRMHSRDCSIELSCIGKRRPKWIGSDLPERMVNRLKNG